MTNQLMCIIKHGLLGLPVGSFDDLSVINYRPV